MERMPTPFGESPKPNQTPAKPSRIEKTLRSPMLRAGVLAAALHVPFTPAGEQLYQGVQQIAERIGAASRWEQPNMVLKPQSEAEQDVVIEQVQERQRRIDVEARESYRQEVAKRIEQGEDPSFLQMYFELERLNGVDAERVNEAKVNAEAKIRVYSEQFGDSLESTEIQQLTRAMRGSSEQYDWGQASVTEYFRSGKYNCVAIARAQQIVLEGILASMPMTEQRLYQIGDAFEKQHEIATITRLDDLGNPDVTYRLDPFSRSLGGPSEEGSPAVSLKELKKAIVQEQPLDVVSTVQPGGNGVGPSPFIDIRTNQPVPTNITVQGPLRGSNYVQSIARQRNIQPVEIHPKEEQIIELTIERKGDEVRRVIEALDLELANTGSGTVRLGLMKNPKPEDVRTLLKDLEPYRQRGEVSIIEISKLEWTPEALAQLKEYNSFLFDLRNDYDLSRGISRDPIEMKAILKDRRPNDPGIQVVIDDSVLSSLLLKELDERDTILYPMSHLLQLSDRERLLPLLKHRGAIRVSLYPEMQIAQVAFLSEHAKGRVEIDPRAYIEVLKARRDTNAEFSNIVLDLNFSEQDYGILRDLHELLKDSSDTKTFIEVETFIMDQYRRGSALFTREILKQDFGILDPGDTYPKEAGQTNVRSEFEYDPAGN